MPESFEAVEAKYKAALRKIAKEDGVTLECDLRSDIMSKPKKPKTVIKRKIPQEDATAKAESFNGEEELELVAKAPGSDEAFGNSIVTYHPCDRAELVYPAPAPVNVRLIVQPDERRFTPFNFHLINAVFNIWLFIGVIVLSVGIFIALYFIITYRR